MSTPQIVPKWQTFFAGVLCGVLRTSASRSRMVASCSEGKNIHNHKLLPRSYHVQCVTNTNYCHHMFYAILIFVLVCNHMYWMVTGLLIIWQNPWHARRMRYRIGDIESSKFEPFCVFIPFHPWPLYDGICDIVIIKCFDFCIFTECLLCWTK